MGNKGIVMLEAEKSGKKHRVNELLKTTCPDCGNARRRRCSPSVYQNRSDGMDGLRPTCVFSLRGSSHSTNIPEERDPSYFRFIRARRASNCGTFNIADDSLNR